MSSDVPQVTDPPMRLRLTEAAARLVAGGGPSALTARRVASEAGTSTMAVYTQFGSMEALIRAVIEEGFGRLEQRFLTAQAGDDPVVDLGRLAAAYVEHARENPELYQVMFGTAPLGSYRPTTSAELSVGRKETLDRVGEALTRAVEDGRLRGPSSSALSFRWWAAVHGYVMLEAAGYIARDRGPQRVLGPLLVDFLVGEGDDPEYAATSVRAGLTELS